MTPKNYDFNHLTLNDLLDMLNTGDYGEYNSITNNDGHFVDKFASDLQSIGNYKVQNN